MARTKRKAQQVEGTRSAILDAAIRAFAAKGFDAATMRDIAREADYTAPSLYNYFGSKEEILLALVDRLYSTFMALFEEQLPRRLAFAERLEILVTRQFELAETNQDAIRLLMGLQTSAGVPKSVGKQQLSCFTDQMDRLTRWIRRAASRAELGGRKPEDLSFFLWSLTHGAYVRWLLYAEPKRFVDAAPPLIDLFFNGVGVGAKAREGG